MDRRTFLGAGMAGIAGASALRAAHVVGESPKIVRHLVVYAEPGRFAGWPANHGIWSWGDEILVGFSRGTYKDRGESTTSTWTRPRSSCWPGAETAG